jgi:hypothetical protein
LANALRKARPDSQNGVCQLNCAGSWLHVQIGLPVIHLAADIFAIAILLRAKVSIFSLVI